MADKEVSLIKSSDIFIRYRCTLQLIADDFTSEHVKRAAFVLGRSFKDCFNNIDRATDLFLEMERRDMLGPKNMGYLKAVLPVIILDKHIPTIEQFEREIPVLFKGLDIQSDAAFVGRKNDLKKVQRALSPTTVRPRPTIDAVVITGFAGIGKTTLAREVIAKLNSPHPYTVDLRGLSNIEGVFFATMGTLGKHVKDYKLHLLLDAIKDLIHDCILFFDNADKMLEPGSDIQPNVFRDPFISFIESILHTKNKRIKLIITSRYSFPEDYKLPLQTVRLDKMSLEDSIGLIRFYAGQSIELQEKEAKSIAQKCGFHPYAMKIVATRLKGGHLSVRSIEKELSRKLMNTLDLMELKDVDNSHHIEMCLETTFNDVPNETKVTLIMLSVIPGTFDAKATRHILEKEAIDAQLDLQALCHRNLLEFTSGEGHKRYKLHLLLRSYITESSKHNEQYKKAKANFVKYFKRKILETAEMMTSKQEKAMKRKDEELVNFEFVLRSSREWVDGFSAKTFSDLVQLLDLMWNVQDREVHFKSLADEASKQQNWLCHAEMCSHLGQQMLDLSRPIHECKRIFEQAQMSLQKVSNTHQEEVQLVNATYNHYYGNMLCQDPSTTDDGLKCLKKAVDIRRRLLGDYSHLLARSLSDLGYAYRLIPQRKQTYWNTHIPNAMKCFDEALKIRLKIGERHFDTCTYLLNIGAVCEEKNKFRMALGFYERALDLGDQLKTSGFTDHSYILRNIGTVYFKMRHYESALKFAKKALSIRKDMLKLHPDTAAVTFFVGIIYVNMNKTEKAFKYLDQSLEMYEDLTDQGSQIESSEWEELKDITVKACKLADKMTELPTYQTRFKRVDRKLKHALSSSGCAAGDDESSSSTESSAGSYPGQRKKIRVEMKPYLEHDDSDSDSSEIGNSLHRDIQRMRYQDYLRCPLM